MSSSQTMTAPAVGHRHPPNPNAGRDMSSLYDYGLSQQQPDNRSPSPRDDSAIRALHDSASDHPGSPSNGLTSLSTGMNGIKSEPDGLGSDSSVVQQDQESSIRRQSAASALLAQLLGYHQSSAPSAGTQEQSLAPPSQADQPPNPTENNSTTNNLNDTTNGDVSTTDFALTSGPLKSAVGQDPFSMSTELSGPHQGEKDSNQFPDLPLSNPGNNANARFKTPDPSEGLSDPLLFSKSGLDHQDLFTPFDMNTVTKNPFDELQQNDMAAYLSQSAELSALGYSGGHLQDGTGSVAGSEPRIQAFAKLEFDDGHFYCNTYSFILGRDVRAARAAHQREFQARQVRQALRTSRPKSSSGGNASHTPIRVKHEGSGMIGSVVSDRGGIMGFDPDLPPHIPSRLSRRSSNSSESGAPLHANPAQLQTTTTTDYNALAMQSLHEGGGDAKPVDALALLPSPDACPTIPIHPPATVDGSAAGHRGISRKHVKISYNFDKNLFEMEVMGRNGAFIGADWLSPGQLRPLHSGDYIQIGGVRIRFLLPDVPIGETGADRVEEPDVEEDETAEASVKVENDADGGEKGANDSAENKDTKKSTKIVLKTKESDTTGQAPSIEESRDGSQQPRRRGPGRPPKDGIMSKRERAELAREQKIAAKREANGGVTPPPQNRPKPGTTTTAATPGTTVTTPTDLVAGESPGSRPEKRKYTKRKKADGTPMDIPLPSVEGSQFPMEPRPEEYVKPPPVKKRKPSRSPSPNYPPESAYTPEDLAKPPYNYAVLIFDALTEAGTPMTLKQIYRALKLKYPYFRFKCETEGWTSSVRHNLNGNSHLFMHAERDGKGWSWQLRPGASVEKEKKRRPSPPPPSSLPPSIPASTPQYMPALNPSYPNPQNGQANMANQHFQFPPMPSNPYTAPAQSTAPTPTSASQHQSPYAPAPPAPASTNFPIPSPLRNNLPPAFAQTTPSTYTSPYASNPSPQVSQFQQPPTMHSQPQHPSHYPPQNPQPLPTINPPAQNLPANPGPPLQHHQPHQQQQQQQQQQPPPPPNYGVAPINSNPAPIDNSEASFNERAGKAIDDFEAVLMEDYEDKNYIREVLKSARARALGEATESSFPGGEPKDEVVILDVLRNLIEGLREQ